MLKAGYPHSCKFPGRKERGMEGGLRECLGGDRGLILREGRFDHLKGLAPGFVLGALVETYCCLFQGAVRDKL